MSHVADAGGVTTPAGAPTATTTPPAAAAPSVRGRGRQPVLEARDVRLHFPGVNSKGERITIRALDGVDFALYPGEICALVGESGSGKTTIARLFSLIYRPTSGELLHDGSPIRVKGSRAERAYYRNVQLIYQDPFASLNGLKRIRTILGRVVQLHFASLRRTAVRDRVVELLEKVNLTPADRYLDRYPTDLSGGQRQRVAIARGLAVQPKVLLADEPTSMLDASIRLDVLNLLADLRESDDVAVLYITHDIASARYLSDRISVMYGGRIVEEGPTEAVISSPVHPYTKLLLAAAPDPARYKGSGRTETARVENANPVNNTTEVLGCRFADRCPVAREKCTTQPLPEFRDPAQGRLAQCWEAEDIAGFQLAGSNRARPTSPGGAGRTART